MRSLRRSSFRSPASSSSSAAARADARSGVRELGQRVADRARGARRSAIAVTSRPSTSRADAMYATPPTASVWKPAVNRRPATGRAPRPYRWGSTRIEFGPQNGVCVKCEMARSGRACAHHPGHERERVVVHEHVSPSGACPRSPRRRTPGSRRRSRPTRPRRTRRTGAADEVEQPVDAGTTASDSRHVVVQLVQMQDRARANTTSVSRGGFSAPCSTAAGRRRRCAAATRSRLPRACPWTSPANGVCPPDRRRPRLAAMLPSPCDREPVRSSVRDEHHLRSVREEP